MVRSSRGEAVPGGGVRGGEHLLRENDEDSSVKAKSQGCMRNYKYIMRGVKLEG